MWTDIPKPSAQSYSTLTKPAAGFSYTAGMTVGMIIPLTTPARIIGNAWINISKPGAGSWTNISKPT